MLQQSWLTHLCSGLHTSALLFSGITSQIEYLSSVPVGGTGCPAAQEGYYTRSLSKLVIYNPNSNQHPEVRGTLSKDRLQLRTARRLLQKPRRDNRTSCDLSVSSEPARGMEHNSFVDSKPKRGYLPFILPAPGSSGLRV